MKARAALAFGLLLSGCVKGGYPGLMCQYKGNFSAVDDFISTAGKDAAGYRPTTDKLGNVYVVGYAMDSTDQEHWIVRKSADRGASWTTVEDFQLISGKGSIGLGLLSQPSGGLISVGYALGVTAFEWVVRRSLDAGTTWTTPERFQLAVDKTASANAITQDSGGTTYVMGLASDDSNVYHWLVRKSTDGGATWSTVDDYNAASGKDASAEGGAFDQSGALYVTGNATNGSDISRWTVRKTLDGGATWLLSDEYTKDGVNSSIASSAAVDYENTVIVAGYARNGSSVPVWTIRKSTDGGSTWATVDEYSLSDGQESQANSVVTDPFGNFYVVGSAVDALTRRHLILRKSSDRGATWATIHDYQVASDADTSGYRLSSDPDGNLYVVGRGQTGPGSSYRWFTHRLLCE